jgi:hypothetical protein
LPTACASSSRNDWNAHENALLRGARSAPVGTPSGISVARKSKFGTNRAGNSTALMFAEFEKPWDPRSLSPKLTK